MKNKQTLGMWIVLMMILLIFSTFVFAADNDKDGYDDTVDCDDGDASVYPGATEKCDVEGKLYNCVNRNYFNHGSLVMTTPLRGLDPRPTSQLYYVGDCPQGYFVTGFSYIPNGPVFSRIFTRCTQLIENKGVFKFGNSFYPNTATPENELICPESYVVVGMNYLADAPYIRGFQPICKKIELINGNIKWGDQINLNFIIMANVGSAGQDLCPEGGAVTSSLGRHDSGVWRLFGFGNLKCTGLNLHKAEKTYGQVCPKCQCSDLACQSPGNTGKKCDGCNYIDVSTIAEKCGSGDENCNGQIDEGFAKTLYKDNDADGYGNPAQPLQTTTCATTPKAGEWVVDNSDCNDNNKNAFISRTKEIYHATESVALGFGDNANDKACCNSATACAYGGVCYAAGYYDLNGDSKKEAICYSSNGKWISADYYPNWCTSNNYYWNVGKGDANAQGSYNPTYSGYIYPDGCKNHPGSASIDCCCGDDTGENYETRLAYQVANDRFHVSWNNEPNDKACCDDAKDCVSNGACYAPGSIVEILGAANDKKTLCESASSQWLDVDGGSAYCASAGYSWVKKGETGVGEFDSKSDGGAEGDFECCGDDSGENYNYVRGRHDSNYYAVSWADNTNIKACCNNLDCVDLSGNCRADHEAASGFNPSGNDNIAVCEWIGTKQWFDCDYDSTSCSNCGLSRVIFGETTGEGTKGQQGCCGDDSLEYYAPSCPDAADKHACCDNVNDYVNKDGECVAACNAAPVLGGLLGSSRAKGGSDVVITATGVSDINNDLLSLYCSIGSEPDSVNYGCVSIGSLAYDDIKCSMSMKSQDTALADSPYTLSCRLYDGKLFSDIKQIIVTVDSTPPVIKGLSGFDGVKSYVIKKPDESELIRFEMSE